MTRLWTCRARRLRRTTAVLVALVPANASAQRIVAPRTAAMDEAYTVRATGLRPGERVTVRATMRDSAQRTWHSEATFAADARGDVDVARQPPLDGSYAGVQPMGLVTSMDLPERPGTAVYVAPSLGDVPVTYTLHRAERQVDSAVVVRRFLAPDIRALTLGRETGLVGTLFTPAAPRVSRAVLVLGGSEGGNSAADVAALLASRGFTTFALAYFGVEPLPLELDRIPLEYFGRAIDFLVRQPNVDPTSIAVFGTSKGAEAALLVAANDRRVRAVVAYTPSSVAWSCICASPEHSSWTLGGADLPSVPPGRDPSVKTAAGEPLRPVVHYLHRMRDSAAVERARIRVERVDGPVMLVAGEADALWPSAEMARSVRARLDATAGRSGDTLLVYEGAGHRIGKAYLPAGSTRVAGGRLETGGSPGANAAAQRDAWPEVLRFLARTASNGRD